MGNTTQDNPIKLLDGPVALSLVHKSVNKVFTVSCRLRTQRSKR